MKVVFDTNVLVASARSKQGASFALLSMLPSERFELALSVSLYTEWQAVMTRPENLPPGLVAEDTLAFLRYLASISHLQDVFYLWRPRLKDPDDDMVLECALKPSEGLARLAQGGVDAAILHPRRLTT